MIHKWCVFQPTRRLVYFPANPFQAGELGMLDILANVVINVDKAYNKNEQQMVLKVPSLPNVVTSPQRPWLANSDCSHSNNLQSVR